MPLFVVEATSEAVRSFFDTADEPIVVSEFAAAEFSSAVSRVSRTGEIEPAMADRHVMDFDVWREAFTTDVEIAPGDFRSATAIVRPLKLKVPNAETRAAKKEAREMMKSGKLRFKTAEEMFESLDREVERLARGPLASSREP